MLKIFDPAMCCSTGVCGPDVDPALVQFAADLKGLAAEGVPSERFNLGQQPEAFVAEPAVREALAQGGVAALPLVVVDGRVVLQGRYPSRDELRELAEAPAAGDADLAPELITLDLADAGCCSPSSNCC